jgi:hypothetical protein
MQATHLIEFVGGPFDGHVQPLSLETRSLVAVALLPVSRTVFGWLEGKSTPVGTRVTSVAVYRLEVEDGHVRYRFRRALPPVVDERRSAS